MQVPFRAQRLAGPGPMHPAIEPVHRVRGRPSLVDARGEQHMQVIPQTFHLAHQGSAPARGAGRAHVVIRMQCSGTHAPFEETLRLLQVVLDLERVAVVDGVDEIQAQAPAIQADVGNRPWRHMAALAQHAVLPGPPFPAILDTV